MDMKLYYANVEVSCVEYFEENLNERKDLVEIMSKEFKTSENGTQYIRYVLAAKEGVIAPEYAL